MGEERGLADARFAMDDQRRAAFIDMVDQTIEKAYLVLAPDEQVGG
jgi:hypothetical protein